MADEIKTPKRFGWLPELPDQRDYLYSAAIPRRFTEAEVADNDVLMIEGVLPPEDQGYTGSCVGWAVGSLYSFVHGVARRSALQIYYEARRLLGEPYLKVDSGSHIRDAIKYVCNYGAGRDTFWPNVETNFDVDPPEFIDRDALRRKKGTYYSLTTGEDFRRCLTEGFPFVIGFTVYANFGSRASIRYGIVGMPSGSVQGGHAVLVIGYHPRFKESDWAKRALAAGIPASVIPERAYIVRNSWGADYHNNGDFAINADYLENPNLADDAWTIRVP